MCPQPPTPDTIRAPHHRTNMRNDTLAGDVADHFLERQRSETNGPRAAQKLGVVPTQEWPASSRGRKNATKTTAEALASEKFAAGSAGGPAEGPAEGPTGGSAASAGGSAASAGSAPTTMARVAHFSPDLTTEAQPGLHLHHHEHYSKRQGDMMVSGLLLCITAILVTVLLARRHARKCQLQA